MVRQRLHIEPERISRPDRRLNCLLVERLPASGVSLKPGTCGGEDGLRFNHDFEAGHRLDQVVGEHGVRDRDDPSSPPRPSRGDHARFRLERDPAAISQNISFIACKYRSAVHYDFWVTFSTYRNEEWGDFCGSPTPRWLGHRHAESSTLNIPRGANGYFRGYCGRPCAQCTNVSA
jgi:hypothetical protein